MINKPSAIRGREDGGINIEAFRILQISSISPHNLDDLVIAANGLLAVRAPVSSLVSNED